MRQVLQLHAGSRSRVVTGIEVRAVREGASKLSLRYFAEGTMADVRLPPLVRHARADDLWRHTCFEAFVKGPKEEGYCEFHFSPSTAWAAYRFTGYREAMSPIDEVAPPFIEVLAGDRRLELYALLDLEGLPELPPASTWQIGLSAVVQDTGGNLSYWSLAHPPGRPDFHHANSFALKLAPEA